MKRLVLLVSHVVALAIGFALGIYALPILVAPDAPSTADVRTQAAAAAHKGQFRRDLKDSDALHWGEGTVSVSARSIGLTGELAPGPDYKLYLSPKFVETEAEFKQLKPSMVRVGDVKTFKNFLIAVPEAIDVEQYNTVVIWCETFSQFITAAKYKWLSGLLRRVGASGGRRLTPRSRADCPRQAAWAASGPSCTMPLAAQASCRGHPLSSNVRPHKFSLPTQRMKLPTHTANARARMDRLSQLGLPPPIQQRIGAFAVSWGLFETTLERAVWRLRKEDVKGARPSTDKSQVSDWIIVLGHGSTDFTPAANEVLRTAATAAEDLMHYRHSLMHGTLVAIPGAPFFIRNPRWNGEVRKREAGDAQVDENLLDLAIDAAWTLFQTASLAEKSGTTPKELIVLESLKPDVSRVRGYANELRHLAALMNHEKY